jgi:hypothetical protein
LYPDKKFGYYVIVKDAKGSIAGVMGCSSALFTLDSGLDWHQARRTLVYSTTMPWEDAPRDVSYLEPT